MKRREFIAALIEKQRATFQKEVDAGKIGVAEGLFCLADAIKKAPRIWRKHRAAYVGGKLEEFGLPLPPYPPAKIKWPHEKETAKPAQL